MRRYSPQLDRVIEAPTLYEWNAKVQAELHGADPSDLTVKELKDKLDEQWVEYSSNDKKETLVELVIQND